MIDKKLASILMVLAATLLCAQAGAVTAPYTEDFESEPTCGGTCATVCTLSTSGWTNDTTDNRDWLVDVAGTTSSLTGPPSDHTLGTNLGKYLYVETSSPCDVAMGVSNLISPPLELAGMSVPGVQFWYHAYGSDQGTLHVDVLDASMAVIALDVVPPITDNLNAWQQTQPINLAPFIAQGNVHLRIRSVHSGTGFEGDTAIDDFTFDEFVQPDVAVVSVDSPIGGCGLGQEAVAVTLQNLSGLPVSNFNVQYTVNGGAPQTEVFTGTIAGFGTASFSFAATANMSAFQTHTVTVTTLLAGDVDASNDVGTIMISNGMLVAAPYLEDFEAGPGGWIAGGTASSWEFGTPAQPIVNGAASGVNAWMTGLATNYSLSENSFIMTDFCLDISAMTNPAVSLSIWWQAEFSWDGAVLQSSIDGASSWQNVGALGDNLNWYNDATINGNPGGQQTGWTGRVVTGNSSNGWVTAIRNLAGLTGQSQVRFRVAFGSDTSVADEGVAIDDFNIFDNVVNSIQVSNFVGAAPFGATAPGSTDVLVQTFSLFALGGSVVNIDAITIANTGTAMDADIVAAKLWLDDGDGVFDPMLDTVVDTQTLMMAGATFNTVGNLGVPSLDAALLFVSYDLAMTAPPGATFSSEIVNPAMDVVVSGNAPVTATNPPIAGQLFPIAGIVSTLPFTDDYSTIPLNRSTTLSGASFPTATVAGPTVGMSAAYTNQASIAAVPSAGVLNPVVGTNVALIDFPNGVAVGAIDYHFDLSAFSAATNIVMLTFDYSDAGEELDPEDNVFISVDGGVTWIASLYRFDWSTTLANGFAPVSVDVSAALIAAGADYTADVVIRFQANDDTSVVSDGLVLDDMFVGRAPQTLLERPVATPIADDGIDALGSIAAVPQSLGYSLTNLGDMTLDINVVAGISSANEMNVTNLVITQPANLSLPGGANEMFQVDFDPGIGAFSFDLTFFVNDPYLSDGVYTITVTGDGNEAIPEIDVQQNMTSIASGMTQDQGTVMVNMSQQLSYEVHNLGYADLNISGATVGNATNVNATMDTEPSALLATMSNSPMEVSYTVVGDGPFSFDIVVANDDSDEGSYTITISGEGDDPNNTGGGGSGPATSSSGTGGAGGAGGAGSGGGEVDAGGGCGCIVATGNNNNLGWTLLLGAFGMALLRRKRRG